MREKARTRSRNREPRPSREKEFRHIIQILPEEVSII